MKLSELIALYGDDRVQFQRLDECATSLNMDKNGTKITFGTPQRIGIKGTEQLGLVVWLDREAAAEIIKAWRRRPVYEAPRDPAVPLRVRGVGRVADEPRALLLALNERPTDDEIRALHDHLREVVIS